MIYHTHISFVYSVINMIFLIFYQCEKERNNFLEKSLDSKEITRYLRDKVFASLFIQFRWVICQLQGNFSST
jgi:hypothetical protein